MSLEPPPHKTDDPVTAGAQNRGRTHQLSREILDNFVHKIGQTLYAPCKCLIQKGEKHIARKTGRTAIAQGDVSGLDDKDVHDPAGDMARQPRRCVQPCDYSQTHKVSNPLRTRPHAQPRRQDSSQAAEDRVCRRCACR